MSASDTHVEVRCSKSVSDRTGFHFWACGKPAKFRVWFADGPVKTYCGIHTHQAKKRRGCNVLPLSDEKDVAR